MNHLAIIMDGNRRWAKKKLLALWDGHRQGVQSIKTAIDFSLDQAITYLSLYAFSLENFKRSPQELEYLFSLMLEQAEQALPELKAKNINVRFIGDRAYFPKQLINTINFIENATKTHRQLYLTLFFCYGGRQEIIAAIEQIAQDIRNNKISGEFTEHHFQHYLWTKHLPDPELIIRTGGMHRLSNFLLFQAAYSELYFLDCLWPELTKEHLEQALLEYKKRDRNFGA